MKSLKLVAGTRRIKVDTSRGYVIKLSGINTSIFRATYNDYYHDIHEFKYTGKVKSMEEFYDGKRKGLFDISNWFGRCWLSAYRYINLRSLRNLEDD